MLGLYELLSKLLVSLLISPKIVPHKIPDITRSRSLDYSSYGCWEEFYKPLAPSLRGLRCRVVAIRVEGPAWFESWRMKWTRKCRTTSKLRIFKCV